MPKQCNLIYIFLALGNTDNWCKALVPKPLNDFYLLLALSEHDNFIKLKMPKRIVINYQ